MGCGESYSDPAGCQGSRCIEWCKVDMCNSLELALKYGYTPSTKGGEGGAGGGGTVTSSQSVFCKSLGIFCSGACSSATNVKMLCLSCFVLVIFFQKLNA